MRCIEVDQETKNKVLEKLGSADLMEQLAEECVELAHVALKLARKYRDTNPTPADYRTLYDNMSEEVSDVMLVLEVLDCRPSEAISERKLDRWVKRLESRDENARAIHDADETVG